MATFTPSPSWSEAVPDYRIRNFGQNRAGDYVPLSAQKYGLESINETINHLAAYQPKIIYCQSWAQNYHYFYTADPLIQWMHYDYNYNGREFKIDMIVNFRANSEAYFFLTGDQFYQTVQCYGDLWGPDWAHLTIDYVRGDALNATVTEGLSQIADYELELWDIVIQEKPIETLDNEIHLTVTPGKTRDHTRLTTEEIEEMRSTLHKLRVQNLPMVLSWSALTKTGISSTQASDQFGITITSNSLINVWDLTSTSRTTTSPGTLFYAYHSGRGNETNNTNLRVVVSAYCRVVPVLPGPVGTIRFEGPNHVASNYIDLSPTNTSFDWIGGDPDNDYFYLNTAADYDDLTLAMNKVDILASINSTNKLQILGLFAWICYD